MDITRSNQPPTRLEEAVLRRLLEIKQQELDDCKEKRCKLEESLQEDDEAIEHFQSEKVATEAAIQALVDHRDMLTKSCANLKNKCTMILPASLNSAQSSVTRTTNAEFREGISRAEAEVEKMDASITRLRMDFFELDQDLRCRQFHRDVAGSSLRGLCMTVYDVEGAISRINGEFKAVKRIPAEVWAEILIFHIKCDGRPYPQDLSPAIFLPALAVSHVCQLWRRVAFSTPVLWTDLFWSSSRASSTSGDLISLCLKSCGSRSPTIHQGATNESRWPSFHEFPVPSFKEQSEICYSFGQLSLNAQLVDPEAYMDDAAMRFQPGKLRVEGHHLSTPSLGEAFFARFTRVHTLCVQNVTLCPGFSLPTSIEHLTISFNVPKEYNLGVFLHSNLKSLSLQHSALLDVSMSDRVLTLESLHTLEITPLEHSIVSRLSLPRLIHLTICHPRPHETLPSGWLKSLDSVWPTLVSLTLIGRDRKFYGRQRYEVASTLSALCSKGRGPCQVTLSGISFVHTELTKWLETNSLSTSRPVLQSLIIQDCAGLSRAECERLAALGYSLQVQDTFRTIRELESRLIFVDFGYHVVKLTL